MLDDGEAEAGAAHRPAPARIDAVEAFRQAREMIGRDALALIDDLQSDHRGGGWHQPDGDRRARTAIFGAVADKIMEQLRNLGAVPLNHRHIVRNLGDDVTAARAQILATGYEHLLDQRGEFDLCRGQAIFVRFDAGERHQVIDQLLHPPGFILKDRQEPPACLGIAPGVGILQGFDKPEDGGERCPQFMARIGDEIAAHALGGIGAALVGQMNEQSLRARHSIDGNDLHRPTLVARAEADNIDLHRLLQRLLAGESFRRRRVADGDAHILADDMVAEQLARAGVRHLHPAALDDQHGLGQPVDDPAETRHFEQIRGGRKQAGGLGLRDFYRVLIPQDKDQQPAHHRQNREIIRRGASHPGRNQTDRDYGQRRNML